MKKYSQTYNLAKILLPALVIVLMLSAVPVLAISVSGAKYMGNISPGEVAVHTMTVGIGPGEDPTDVQVEVMGFGQSMDKGYTTLDPANDLSSYTARPFITLDKNTLHLEPGTTQNINANITLPKNVGAGGRYAIIYIHALPGAGKSFTTAVIVPVLITDSGTALVETGSITNLDVSDVTIGQPITVTTTLQNTGNYHYYRTVNEVLVTDASGNTIATNSTPPSVYAIIPGNTVGFIIQPDIKNLPLGTYTVNSKVLLEDGRVLDNKTTTFAVKTVYIPPVTESSIKLTPGSAGTLVSPDGRYTVLFPQGSVLGDVVVTLKPYSRDKLQPAPAGATTGATSFEISGLSGLLSKDATVRVTYSADDLAAAGGDPSKMKLSYYDTAKNEWTMLPTQVNTQDMTLTTTTNHLSVWAVMIPSSAATAVPTKAPLPVVVSVGALIAAAIVSCCFTRHRK
ncbi:MAG: hypothetical protein WCJ93_04020 [Methanomicrobiales archaeon]